MNRRGMEMAISTLIILVLAVLLLLGLVVLVTGGFTRFKASTDPFTDTMESSAVREACRLACTTENYPAYCCTEHTLAKEVVLCSDSRLDVTCPAVRCDLLRCAR